MARTHPTLPGGRPLSLAEMIVSRDRVETQRALERVSKRLYEQAKQRRREVAHAR